MTSPHVAQIRVLLSAALALFTFTVVIGIFSGTDLVDFGHKALPTHVHVAPRLDHDECDRRLALALRAR